MNEETLLKIFRMIIALILVGIYAFTGADGIILTMAAFLFGLPLEYWLGKREEKLNKAQQLKEKRS